MKLLSFKFFAAIFSFIFLVNICTNDSYSSNENKIRLVLFGDSIVAGYGVTKQKSLPEQLKAYLDNNKYSTVEVIDAGVSGDTTSGGKNRIKWVVDKYKPDILLIALGGNDVLRGIPPEVVANNMKYMLDYTTKKEINTIVSLAQATPNLGFKYMNEFNRAFNTLENDYNIKTYPFLIEKTFGNTKLMQSDGIHPNADGVELIAKDLGEFLITNFLSK